MTYQPASRYWAFQWTETAIYLAVALLLAGLCFLRIRPGRPAEPGIHRPRAIRRPRARKVPVTEDDPRRRQTLTSSSAARSMARRSGSHCSSRFGA